MSKEEILSLIAQGEGQRLEFKESVAELDRVIQTLTAFANTNSNGGCVLVGVGDKGKIKEVIIGQETIKQIADKISAHTDPVLYPKIEVVKESGDKGIIVITIDGSPNKPHLAFGRAYKRVGSTTTQMTRDEYERMLLAKHEDKFRFDSQVCKGTTIEDIDEEKVRWYLETRRNIRKVETPKGLHLKQILVSIGALFKDFKPTNSGVLMFGKAPQRFIQVSEVRCARFEGTTMGNFIDRIDLEGALPEMINGAVDFVRKNVRLGGTRDLGIRRVDRLEYPLKVIREAITNAVAHRDYFIPSEVRVAIFDDRIEIHSPGEFLKEVDITRPIHITRNKIVCNMLYDVGLIEKWGSGLMMMKEEMIKWGLREPKIENIGEAVVTLYGSGWEIVETIAVSKKYGDILLELNGRQREALKYIERNKKITNKEYRNLTHATKKTATRDLSDLVSKEIFIPKGKGPNTYYIQK